MHVCECVCVCVCVCACACMLVCFLPVQNVQMLRKKPDATKTKKVSVTVTSARTAFFKR